MINRVAITELVKVIQEPKIIFNRFDLMFGGDFDLLKVDEFYVPLRIKKSKAVLGLYLTKVSPQAIEELIDYIFKNYKKVKKIEFKHCLTPVPGVKPAPHWHVELSNKEDFDKALSNKTRYNTKWYPKKIREEVGEFEIKHFSKDKISQGVVDKYLEFKRKTHEFEWKKDHDKYLDEMYITDAYAMYIKGEIKAIAFMVTIDDEVFLENLTYDVELSKYSLGSVIYYHALIDMMEKGIKKVYLLGGTLDYKRRFNGIETQTYTGTVRKPNMLKYWFNELLYKINRCEVNEGE